jgi:hypothetical protein
MRLRVLQKVLYPGTAALKKGNFVQVLWHEVLLGARDCSARTFLRGNVSLTVTCMGLRQGLCRAGSLNMQRTSCFTWQALSLPISLRIYSLFSQAPITYATHGHKMRLSQLLKMGVFWAVTPCGCWKNRRFGGT